MRTNKQQFGAVAENKGQKLKDYESCCTNCGEMKACRLFFVV